MSYNGTSFKKHLLMVAILIIASLSFSSCCCNGKDDCGKVPDADAQKSVYDIRKLKYLCEVYGETIKQELTKLQAKKEKDKTKTDKSRIEALEAGHSCYNKAYSSVNAFVETFLSNSGAKFNKEAAKLALADCDKPVKDFQQQYYILYPLQKETASKSVHGGKITVNALNISETAALITPNLLSSVIEGFFKGGLLIARYYDEKKEKIAKQYNDDMNSAKWLKWSDLDAKKLNAIIVAE